MVAGKGVVVGRRRHATSVYIVSSFVLPKMLICEAQGRMQFLPTAALAPKIRDFGKCTVAQE
jgi:hypothetical protein